MMWNRCGRICCQNSRISNDPRKQRNCEQCASLGRRYVRGLGHSVMVSWIRLSGNHRFFL